MKYIRFKWSWVFVMIASIFDAIMDTITHHFPTSIFKNLDQKFWNPEVSWKFAKYIFAWKMDAWHICKSLMIISLIMAILSYKWTYKQERWADFTLLGLIWNIIFGIFYNFILN